MAIQPIIPFTKYLENIGTKLSDFEEIPHKGQNFFFLGKGSFGYAEKMKSKKDGKFYAVKKIDRHSEKFNIKDFKRETLIKWIVETWETGIKKETVEKIFSLMRNK